MRDTTLDTLKLVILKYYEDLGSPFALSCAIMLRNEMYEELVRRTVDPASYLSAEDYFRDASAAALLKKFSGLLDNADARRAAAVEKWFEAEKHCFETNQRLKPYFEKLNLERDDTVARHLAGIRSIVEELIGSRPDSLVEGRFGPGATFADRGTSTTVPHKMSSDPTITSDAVWYLPQFFGTAWGKAVAERGASLVFVRPNRFTTVGKTSVIDRSIAIEPSINLFFQLGYGRMIRRRLKALGWDLDYAQDIHREVARKASVSREYSTLDLSSASDTVSSSLVKLLLPHAWYSCLNDLRSKYTTHPDHPEMCVELEKFSSMGNGFTFELETVIFAAICCYVTRTCSEGKGALGSDVFVFGDDIIVKTEVVNAVIALLRFCGFSLNLDKSFVGDSPFRESCGGDYYLGSDVRPAYLKEMPDDPQKAIGVANRLKSTFAKLTQMGVRSRCGSWHLAVQSIPYPYRNLRGPQGLGDCVVWEDDTGRWKVRWRNSIRYIRVLKVRGEGFVPFSRFLPSVVLASAVYGVGNEGTPEGGRVPKREGLIPRSSTPSFSVGWMSYS